jgi:hypothetical protein
MKDTLHTESYRGYTINIVRDIDPKNPREWDNIGTIVCWHRRYRLGDPHKFSNPDEFNEWIREQGQMIVLPVFLYDHSGLAIQCEPFSCPWDSGQIGYIYCTKKQAKKEFDGTDEEVKAKALKWLREEVETYNNYLQGNIAGWVVEDSNGEECDSCWGYFPQIDIHGRSSWDHLIGEAMANIDCIVAADERNAIDACLNI